MASPSEQKNQENLRAIFGNLNQIEPNTEPVQKLAVPTILEIPPPDLSHNDSFGMTNAQFVRQVSESSDIDSPVDEKPKSLSVKRDTSNISTTNQKSGTKFKDLFKRSSPALNSPSKPTNGSLPSPTSHGDVSVESSSNISTGSRATKFFSKIRSYGGDTTTSGSPSSIASPTLPEPTSTARFDRGRPSAPPIPVNVPSSPKYDAKPPVSMRERIRSAYESSFESSVSCITLILCYTLILQI